MNKSLIFISNNFMNKNSQKDTLNSRYPQFKIYTKYGKSDFFIFSLKGDGTDIHWDGRSLVAIGSPSKGISFVEVFLHCNLKTHY